jgi:hypothetical protein
MLEAPTQRLLGKPTFDRICELLVGYAPRIARETAIVTATDADAGSQDARSDLRNGATHV